MNRIRFARLWVLALLLLAVPAVSFAGVFVNITIAPPVLPVYEQPACPGDGYIWTPGYWAYGPVGYYWVPGTWVLAPAPGLLWTPGYWGFSSGYYLWHAGYWGPHVGFYGGVNYGFGYFGSGYAGGYWNSGHFFYNRTVNNITINNVRVYNRTIVNTRVVNRVSYNGGAGGINMRPTRDQENFARERHVGATQVQLQHEHIASSNREMLASTNHGRPPIGATDRPADFNQRDNARPRNTNRPEARNGVPRPSNSARLENGQRNASPERNNVPRPQASLNNEPRVDRTPRPDSRSQNEPRVQNVPRPQNNVRANDRPINNDTRTREINRPQNEPRTQAMPRSQNQPRAQVVPRPTNESRGQAMAHPQQQSRAQAMPRQQQQTRVQAHNNPAARPANQERGGHQGGGPRVR